MYLKILLIDWQELWFGNESWSFLPEVFLRTFIMFILIVLSLRLLGKRGVKQLSIFELVVIISLGSAAGDPMFYKEVGIITALMVFIVVVSFYSLIIYMIGKSKKFENMIESQPVTLIKDGVFSIENYEKENLGEDEFFAELRMQSVSQLGQIEEAIEEGNGHISIFFFPDDEVKYGLPIMPGTFNDSTIEIREIDYYSCIFCGYTEKIEPMFKYHCPTCKKVEWVKSSCRKRVK